MAEAPRAMAEAERSTNTPTTTKRYPLMTINMNGDGKPSERRALSSEIIKKSRPSLVFCQELPDRFIKDVVEKCDTCDYDFVRTAGKEAAVMWNKEHFHGEPVDAALKTKTGEKVVTVYEIDNDIVSEIPGRTAVVKLSSKEDTCNCLSALLAVSWHGPHSGTKMDKKQNVVKALFHFLFELCCKTSASSFIIGGDFNLNTLKNIEVNADLRGLNVFFPHYELSPRGKRAIEIKVRGRPYIPYKDNFAVATISLSRSHRSGEIRASRVRSLSFDVKGQKRGKAAGKDLLATSRPPAITTKSLFTSRSQGKIQVSQVTALSLDVKDEKCGKAGNCVLDHDPITGVLQHGSSCFAPIRLMLIFFSLHISLILGLFTGNFVTR